MRRAFALLLMAVPILIFVSLLCLMPAAFVYFVATKQAELAQAAAVPAGVSIAAILAAVFFAGMALMDGRNE